MKHYSNFIDFFHHFRLSPPPPQGGQITPEQVLQSRCVFYWLTNNFQEQFSSTIKNAVLQNSEEHEGRGVIQFIQEIKVLAAG